MAELLGDPDVENAPEAKLKLIVQNTFLHVVDVPEHGMKKSRSDSDLSSVKSSTNHSSDPISHNRLGPHHIPCLPSSDSNAGSLHSDEVAPAGSDSPRSKLLPSAGSEEHVQGTCTPCSFFPKQNCALQDSCTYCHFEHARESRPGKKHRERARREEKRNSLAQLLAASAGKPDCPQQKSTQSSVGQVSTSGYASASSSGFPL